MPPQEFKTNEAAAQKTAVKDVGLSPIGGVSKYDIQHINDLSVEYKNTQDKNLLKQLTEAKLDAAKNAVDNELKSYLDGWGNANYKVDRTKLEAEYKILKEANPTALTQSDNIGFILLSFLENYETLSTRITNDRKIEQKNIQALVRVDKEILLSEINVDQQGIIASLQKPFTVASSQSQQIAKTERADDSLSEGEEIFEEKSVKKTSTSTKAGVDSKDKLDNIIAKAVKTESAKEAKSKPKFSVEHKAKITREHVTPELIDSIYEPRANKLLKTIHETKSPAESEKLVAELQRLIKIIDDGAFGKNSLTALNTFNQSSKEYGSEMTKIAQNTVNSMPIDALKKNYITIANALAQPNQSPDTINRLSYLLAHINTKAQKNEINLSQNSAAEQIQTVIVTGKPQSTPDAAMSDKKTAQLREKEFKLTKFDDFVKNKREGAEFKTSDSPNITFKFEKNEYFYSVKNGFAPLTKEAALTAFNGKPGAILLAEAILKNKDESRKA